MEKNTNKTNLPKAPWWLKLWGAIAFFGLFVGAAEEPGGGICFWWTFAWVLNFGIFGAISNGYDWEDEKPAGKEAKKTEGAE